jgi:hypothetical protein
LHSNRLDDNIMNRARWALVAVLSIGGLLRLAGAARAPQKMIEHEEFIPGAMTLS